MAETQSVNKKPFLPSLSQYTAQDGAILFFAVIAIGLIGTGVAGANYPQSAIGSTLGMSGSLGFIVTGLALFAVCSIASYKRDEKKPKEGEKKPQNPSDKTETAIISLKASTEGLAKPDSPPSSPIPTSKKGSSDSFRREEEDKQADSPGSHYSAGRASPLYNSLNGSLHNSTGSLHKSDSLPLGASASSIRADLEESMRSLKSSKEDSFRSQKSGGSAGSVIENSEIESQELETNGIKNTHAKLTESVRKDSNKSLKTSSFRSQQSTNSAASAIEHSEIDDEDPRSNGVQSSQVNSKMPAVATEMETKTVELYVDEERLKKFQESQADIDLYLAQLSEAIFNRKPFAQREKKADLELSKEEVAILKDDIENPRARKGKNGKKEFSGGEHTVYTLPEIPGRIFKFNKTEEVRGKPRLKEKKAKKYVESREKARKQPYEMITVPRSYVQTVEIKDDKEPVRYAIVEECESIKFHEFFAIKGLFRWALENSKSEIKEHFIQGLKEVATFIRLNKWSDCKYNNLLINDQGDFVLPDVDSEGSVVGYTKGLGDGKANGLLNYLPDVETLKEFIEMIEKAYTDQNSPKTLAEFKAEVIKNKIQERIAARSQRRSAHAEFLRNKGIKSPIEPIRLELKNIKFDTDNERNIALLIVNFLNSHLQPNADLLTGRKKRIYLGDPLQNDFLLDLQEVFENKRIVVTQVFFNKYLKPALEKLKAHNVIFDYKFKAPIAITSEADWGQHSMASTTGALHVYF